MTGVQTLLFRSENTVQRISQFYNVNSQIIENDLTDFLKNFICQENEEKLPKTYNEQIEKNVDIDKIQFPFSVEFELTKACNFGCPFCYNTWKYEDIDKKEKMHIDKEAIFRVLDECKKNKLLKVRYSGGEPTLYPFLDEVIEYGNNLGFFQSIFTNAYLLNDEKIKFWKENNIKEVLISLHGNEETHESITAIKGSYEKTIENINKLIISGIRVIVEMTLVSSNIEQVEDVIDKLYPLGVDEFRIMKYVPTGSKLDKELSVSDEQFKEVMNKVENNQLYKNNYINILFPCSQKFCVNGNIEHDEVYTKSKKMLLKNCMAGINWVAFDYKGFIKICPHSYEKFDNIYNNDFSILKSWEQYTKPKSMEIINDRESKCHNCRAWESCLGGCLIN